MEGTAYAKARRWESHIVLQESVQFPWSVGDGGENNSGWETWGRVVAKSWIQDKELRVSSVNIGMLGLSSCHGLIISATSGDVQSSAPLASPGSTELLPRWAGGSGEYQGPR